MSNGNTLKNETIIARIVEQFPSYDVSQVNYVSAKDKIKIGCPDHGFFFKAYTKSFECPVCSQERRNKAQTSTREEFIAKSRKNTR